MDEDLYVVGIGSSAGGLAALQAFVKNISAADNTAYVIVQHLKGDSPSNLASILGRETILPVTEIKDQESVKGAHVFIMPPGFKLQIQNGTFQLEPRPQSEVINKAINHFFISLAHNKKSRAFGVILSGTGTDGIEGVKEIEKQKGIVIVQDPKTAQFDGMPENTIHKDHPDYVVSPEAIPQLIMELQGDMGSLLHKKRIY